MIHPSKLRWLVTIARVWAWIVVLAMLGVGIAFDAHILVIFASILLVALGAIEAHFRRLRRSLLEDGARSRG